MRGHLLVDSSTSSLGWLLNTSPLNKSPSTRPQVSRNRHAPSDVPSASKMKQRISEAFGSSKNIIYSDQHPGSGVPETSIPAENIQQRLAPRSSSLLIARGSLLSSSPSRAAVRRHRIPSSLPPSSPPFSSCVDETEGPASNPYRHGTRNPRPEDPYGLLRGHQRFTRHRRRHPPQKNACAPHNALRWLDDLSPMTPSACGSVSSRETPGSRLFAHSRSKPAHRGHGPGGDGGQGGSGNRSDPDASGGSPETLSGLLARLPRGRRLPLRQRQRQHNRATSVSTTTEPSKTAVEKERGQQRRQKRAGDEASHLEGEDRVVRNTVYNNVKPEPELSLLLHCLSIASTFCLAGVRRTARCTASALQRS